jgi:molybdenum cofactor synthesis domain-containing protein
MRQAACSFHPGCGRAPTRGHAARMALFSTGDELVEPGMPMGPAQRYDSNRVLLSALLGRAGAQVRDLGILPDRQDTIADALAEAAQDSDMILTSGGVSAGGEDHVKAAVEPVGGLTFWRLAIKPGRPVAMGTVRGVPFVGLPGNPVAAFITFAHVGAPPDRGAWRRTGRSSANAAGTRRIHLPEEGAASRICPGAAVIRSLRRTARTNTASMGRAYSRRWRKPAGSWNWANWSPK